MAISIILFQIFWKKAQNVSIWKVSECIDDTVETQRNKSIFPRSQLANARDA